jgi:hypothetical protein
MAALPEGHAAMPWYAIRTVYLFGEKPDGTRVFEERVVAFAAASWDEARARGDAESTAYAAANGFEAHPEQAGYEQDGAALVDGCEVWSELFEARMDLHGFYRQRYTSFAFDPGEDA